MHDAAGQVPPRVLTAVRTSCGQAKERHGRCHAQSCGERHCDVCRDYDGRTNQRGCAIDERSGFQDTQRFCTTTLIDQDLLRFLISPSARTSITFGSWSVCGQRPCPPVAAGHTSVAATARAPERQRCATC